MSKQIAMIGLNLFKQKCLFLQNILNLLILVEKDINLYAPSNEEPELKLNEGSLVRANLFPKTHSILQPRFVGPIISQIIKKLINRKSVIKNIHDT